MGAYNQGVSVLGCLSDTSVQGRALCNYYSYTLSCTFIEYLLWKKYWVSPFKCLFVHLFSSMNMLNIRCLKNQ